MICGSAGSKSNLVKAAGAEVAFQLGNEKLHAAVARSTFASQNVQNTAFSDHFLKLRCGKIARRCGEKHIFNNNAPLATCSDHFLKLRCGKIARRCSEKHIFKQNAALATGSDHFLKLRCGKIARRCSEKHICKSKC